MTAPNVEQRLAERMRPAERVVMRQQWAHLLFLHWQCDPAEIQRTLPPGLTVDVHEGHAWLGVVPFFMNRVRPAGLPAVPGFSDFLELNLRTYVHDEQGRPGVWFYSLDCNRWLAVKVARTGFHLPYEHAAMTAHEQDNTVDFRARRRGQPAAGGWRYVYRTDAAGRVVAPGSREFFLLERYRLFAFDARRRRLWSGQVVHPPYRMQPATVERWDATVLRLAGFGCGSRGPDHVCAAEPVDVDIYPLRPVTAGG
ncbi:MAG: DUF2071 domain-containing protein [Opitutaceae bacterium]|nr:DUF2071 domain-containing protein [Opitutaceae bacterium]